PGCGVRSAARNIVTDGLSAVPSLNLVGHGESSQSELATQMFPWLSAAFPTGLLRTDLPWPKPGSVSRRGPPPGTTETALQRLPLTQRFHWASMAAPKGLICGSWAPGTGPKGMLNARSGLPLGIFVTESLPQLATQMLPWRSETVPCGQEMLPCRNPRGPEMAVPSGRNADTLSFRAAMRGSLSHGGSWNP